MEPLEIIELTIECHHKAILAMMSYEWHQEVAKLPEAEQKEARQVAYSLYKEKVRLENAELKYILAQLEENKEALEAGTKRVNEALENLKEVKEVLDAASSLLSIVAKVVAGATDPFALALKAKTFSTFSAKKAIKAGSDKMQPEFYTEEKAPLFLIEEVLHGVELTREKLIITVATGGCTNEGSFRFDINKGSGGQQPYTVTVYRIEPDECDGNFEPIPLSYSREELGIDGPVEFILRNKIGNTSQHRLDI